MKEINIKETIRKLKPIPEKFYSQMGLDICETFNDKIKYYQLKGWDTTNYKLMKEKLLQKLEKNIEIFYEKNKRQ